MWVSLPVFAVVGVGNCYFGPGTDEVFVDLPDAFRGLQHSRYRELRRPCGEATPLDLGAHAAIKDDGFAPGQFGGQRCKAHSGTPDMLVPHPFQYCTDALLQVLEHLADAAPGVNRLKPVLIGEAAEFLDEGPLVADEAGVAIQAP